MAKRKPTIRIDVDSPVANYRQIVDSLRTHLVDGELQPGYVLPSVRRLALELGIAFNTVAQAYRALAEEGWLDLSHGRRATVIDRGLPSGASRRRVAGFRRLIRQMVAKMRAEGWSPRDIATELRLIAERLEP
jgi:DNA-binding transcriptional regulator YhcF (GntR family)